MSEATRCESCGGTVVYDVRNAGATCMFCGGVTLVAVPQQETIPVPYAQLSMTLDPARADASFRQWAQSSWFYPKVLRQLTIQLHPLSIPAWRFFSHLETHWAGLVTAATRSGKRPVSGRHDMDMQHMVPASAGLSAHELTGLQPFDESASAPWDPAQHHHPWEPPALSEVGARFAGHAAMAAHHAAQLTHAHDLARCRVSPIITDRDVRLLMVPVYIGVFRFRDRPWRFVVNAQTGKIVGKAPYDRLKIALVVLGSLLAIVLIGVAIAAFS